MARITESGHWYSQTGEQINSVDGSEWLCAACGKTGRKGKSGKLPEKCNKCGSEHVAWKLVPANVNHAKKLDLCRGVTSITGLAAKGGLDYWKIVQAVNACIQHPYVEGRGMTEKDYLDWAIETGKKVADDMAKRGSEIHAAIQAHILGEDYDPEDHPHVVGAMDTLAMACGDHQWQTEVPAVSNLGYGTKIDLVAPPWLCDIKTKDGDAKKLSTLKLYESYPMQLAAGSRAFEDTTNETCSKFGILLVSRDHPGVSVFRRISQQEIERGWRMFRCLLEFSFLNDNYRPSWAKEE